MKLTEIKRILASGGIQLTKSLGQNFLHDANQIRRILAFAELEPTDRVLEIGPGLGALTSALSVTVKQVLAIEKDRRLIEFLHQQFGSTQGLSLVHADALDYLRSEPARDWLPWKLVANLPYSVGSPLLVELAQMHRGPKLMVTTLQLEVAQRLFAGAGNKHYGLLTLLVQINYELVDWFKIPAACFFPEPEIDSACIKLVRRTAALLSPAQEAVFRNIVKRSFSQRRKMMLKLLKEDWPIAALAHAFAQAELSPQVRAEAVRLDQFVKLSQVLSAFAK
jgi:16S rRNA (adenine1518-N6/adenine1519-N6)-dimethyltransferase